MNEENEIQGLISIIIPVYNVEKYLEKSIESVLRQTYKNLEIIIVDDNSTDQSGAICEQVSNRDRRVKVIHHSLNRGLSEARNTGLELCNGDYIFFMDSDDLIFSDTIKTLYHLIEKTGADVAIGGTITSFAADIHFPVQKRKEESGLIVEYNAIDAIREMLYSKKYSTSVCGKLYKKNVLDGIRFPQGKVFEDLFTLYRIFLKCQKVIYIDKKVYCYFKRPGSLSMKKGLTNRQFDCFEALSNIEANLVKQYPILEKPYQNCYLCFYLRILQNARKGQLRELKDIVKKVKIYRLSVIMDKNALGRAKTVALLSYLGIITTKIVIDCWYDLK